jgi:hypothetical protein
MAASPMSLVFHFYNSNLASPTTVIKSKSCARQFGRYTEDLQAPAMYDNKKNAPLAPSGPIVPHWQTALLECSTSLEAQIVEYYGGDVTHTTVLHVREDRVIKQRSTAFLEMPLISIKHSYSITKFKVKGNFGHFLRYRRVSSSLNSEVIPTENEPDTTTAPNV